MHLQRPSYSGLHVAQPAETLFALIDIDNKPSRTSRYHPFAGSDGIQSVVDALATIGLKKPLIVQSSFSGGVHLIYSFEKTVPSKELAVAMRGALIQAGIEIASGTLELFPDIADGKVNLQPIRTPLSGDKNCVFLEDLCVWSDDLAVFKCLFDQSAKCNMLNSFAIAPPVIDDSFSNTRGPLYRSKYSTGSRYSLLKCKNRLLSGFTASGQSQEIKLCALIIAGVDEGINDPGVMRERVCQLIQECPGFHQFCSHQRQIQNRTYLCQSEIQTACEMTPGGYEGTCKEAANKKKSNDAAKRARKAVVSASKAGETFSSARSDVKYLCAAYGAPARSWWCKPANAKYRKMLDCLIADGKKGT